MMAAVALGACDVCVAVEQTSVEEFRCRQQSIFAFSTVVSELKGHDLTKAPVRNTGGTDINPVLEHATSIPAKRRPKVILIATDGYVGRGRSDLIARLSRTRVVVALTDSGHAADLQPWAHEMIQLPKP